MDADTIWYYYDNNEQDTTKQTKGPFNLRDIDVLLRTSTLTPTTLVFKEGYADWKPLNQADELKECLEEQAMEIIAFTRPERKLSVTSPKIKELQQPSKEPSIIGEQEEEEEIELDEEKLVELKKKIEKKKKKQQKQQQKKKSTWYQPRINSNVYITGLPPDITMQEIKDQFQRAGVIRINPESLQPIIKIYKVDGLCKGDALISYKMVESVAIARDMLDGAEIRQGYTMSVQEAQFQQKGSEYTPRQQKQVDKMNLLLARQKEMTMMGWDGVDENGEGLKIVIMRHMFSPEQAAMDEFTQELYEEVLNELESSIGQVQKMEIFKQHPKGIIKVKFTSPLDAELCIESMNGRYFDGREIQVGYWDGKEDFKHQMEDKAIEEQRLEEFGRWLEQQDDENDNDNDGFDN